ncbi:D-hexose-6-phosphate mutarotase [Alloacidobacterium dinghuense]|uniref:Putative glucose-6-phosphate 1-epimerase n=1 Tax=Alloacidobacterium dinghuense TaxID=2763107 RepID=A0A7G8BDS1_9BACT|nr:D-hexose-6-phosphate mutarotase [Alloacidobacterium dinghuense]QNI30691.1 D-hexose-6-phosphate mutarotase [Alloacidobacterium dinghuense]
MAEIVAGESGLEKVRVSTAAAEADIYLHGAQVTSWRPAGDEDVIFLSKQSKFQDGKAIRGGIPICFPWFRGKADNPKAPAHGVVRTKSWKLDSLEQQQDSVVVTMSTESDDGTRQWWPHEFRVMHRVTVGPELKLELIVTNTGSTAMHFEEALHTYHQVGDAEKVRVSGLDGVVFLDNMDANREKTQRGDVILTQPTDNAYLQTKSVLELVDAILGRRIKIAKENSLSTVVWNPWSSGAKALADLGDEEWRHFACVEASNILSCGVDLAPGAQHTIAARISVAAS